MNENDEICSIIKKKPKRRNKYHEFHYNFNKISTETSILSLFALNIYFSDQNLLELTKITFSFSLILFYEIPTFHFNTNFSSFHLVLNIYSRFFQNCTIINTFNSFLNTSIIIKFHSFHLKIILVVFKKTVSIFDVVDVL